MHVCDDRISAASFEVSSSVKRLFGWWIVPLCDLRVWRRRGAGNRAAGGISQVAVRWTAPRITAASCFGKGMPGMITTGFNTENDVRITMREHRPFHALVFCTSTFQLPWSSFVLRRDTIAMN